MLSAALVIVVVVVAAVSVSVFPRSFVVPRLVSSDC